MRSLRRTRSHTLTGLASDSDHKGEEGPGVKVAGSSCAISSQLVCTVQTGGSHIGTSTSGVVVWIEPRPRLVSAFTKANIEDDDRRVAGNQAQRN
jgi:hypothetical protein